MLKEKHLSKDDIIIENIYDRIGRETLYSEVQERTLDETRMLAVSVGAIMMKVKCQERIEGENCFDSLQPFSLKQFETKRMILVDFV